MENDGLYFFSIKQGQRGTAMTTRRDIENALMRGADSLRDTLDAANYKDYVLPVMFF
jgi:type I restriction-modification system DNA methylase subunit